MFTDEEMRQGKEWFDSLSLYAGRLRLEPIAVAEARRAVDEASADLIDAKLHLENVMREHGIDP
jgi:hypothetical protein